MLKLPDFIENPNPNIYKTGNYVVLDFETTNSSKGSARDSTNRVVLHRLLDPVLDYKTSCLDSAGLFNRLDGCGFLVAHNAKFELHWLRRMGYPIENLLVFDTMMAEKVLAGNRGWSLDLDSLSAKYGGTQKNPLIAEMMQRGICPSKMPREMLGDYCLEDCTNTEIIFKKQLPLLEELGLLGVVYTRCLLLPVLVDIECRGMKLDKERVQGEYNRTKREYDGVLAALAGHLNGTNPGSPKQLAAFLYDVLGFEEVAGYHGRPLRTDKGARKTDKSTLARLRARTKEQKEVLALIQQEAKLGDRLSKYLDKFKRACEYDDGVLYGDISQVVPRTHRLSSQGGKYKVQFHNMDRELKRMITARAPGWEIGEGDQAQLEFRVATELTVDPQGFDDIANGVDVHTITRDFLAAHGQPQTRVDSKPMTFRPVYGGESGTEAEQAYCKFFNAKYHVMHKEQTKWEMQVLRDKYLTTVTGLRFYWPDTRIRPNGKTTEHSAIFNYPVQYFATGEIVPIGLVYLWHSFKALNLKAFLINTVHDSVVWENPPEERKIISDLCQRSLVSCVKDYLNTVYGIQLKVPLEVEIAFSRHWGDKTEVEAND